MRPIVRRVAHPAEPLSSASLRVRAIAALARREYSRAELHRKLSSLAQSDDQLDQVLDELMAEGLLSDQRFAESVARSRGARYGTSRVRFELAQKGVDPDIIEQTAETLRATEALRLHQVWEKKFGAPPASPQDAARQQRFLAQRGFSPEAIGQLMRRLRRGDHEADRLN